MITVRTGRPIRALYNYLALLPHKAYLANEIKS
jgi:hypothetical protein